jgi:hypothetical protein
MLEVVKHWDIGTFGNVMLQCQFEILDAGMPLLEVSH